MKSIQEVEGGELPTVFRFSVDDGGITKLGRDISGGGLHEGEDGRGHDGEPG